MSLINATAGQAQFLSSFCSPCSRTGTGISQPSAASQSLSQALQEIGQLLQSVSGFQQQAKNPAQNAAPLQQPSQVRFAPPPACTIATPPVCACPAPAATAPSIASAPAGQAGDIANQAPNASSSKPGNGLTGLVPAVLQWAVNCFIIDPIKLVTFQISPIGFIGNEIKGLGNILGEASGALFGAKAGNAVKNAVNQGTNNLLGFLDAPFKLIGKPFGIWQG